MSWTTYGKSEAQCFNSFALEKGRDIYISSCHRVLSWKVKVEHEMELFTLELIIFIGTDEPKNWSGTSFVVFTPALNYCTQSQLCSELTWFAKRLLSSECYLFHQHCY